MIWISFTKHLSLTSSSFSLCHKDDDDYDGDDDNDDNDYGDDGDGEKVAPCSQEKVFDQFR